MRWLPIFAFAGLSYLVSCGAKTGLDVQSDAGGDAACDAGPGAFDSGSCSDQAYPLSLERTELEVVIAMDTSGSMDELTAGGVSKLDAVRQAVSDFLLAPESAGIFVSIAFFPQLRADVPPSCSWDSECGVSGACQYFPACSDDGKACVTDADCASGASCQIVGWCENTTVCDAAAYRPPVAPRELPTGATSIINAFAQKIAEGATPSLPALEGALEAAGQARAARPRKKQIVLFATDGLPTACDPAIPGPNVQSAAGIPKVVSAAESGLAHGLQTFVIGVFSPEEEQLAQQNLDAIALAGGSDSAYLITTDEKVSELFVKTLNEIRENASACSFALPVPAAGPLDATRLAVRITGPNGTLWLEPKSSLTDCHPTFGGYMFDRDPLGDEPPTRIELCPSACAMLKADPALSLEVVANCRP